MEKAYVPEQFSNALKSFEVSYFGEGNASDQSAVMNRSRIMAGMVLIYRSRKFYQIGSTQSGHLSGKTLYDIGREVILEETQLPKVYARAYAINRQG